MTRNELILASAVAPGDGTTAPRRITLRHWGRGYVVRTQNMQSRGEHGGNYFEGPGEVRLDAQKDYLRRCKDLGVDPEGNT